jgi:asparagine synthase (glutamine-hydrolysing)
MCGITFYLLDGKNEKTSTFYKDNLLKSSKSIRHRGPDWSGNYIYEGVKKDILMGHERLAIIDPVGGSQPIVYEKENGHKIILVVNGEIYNYKTLKTEDHKYLTDSDCEVIISEYIDCNENYDLLLNKLDGQFGFVLYDTEKELLLAGRDPIGITSLYYGLDKYNNLMICSEMKGLHLCENVFTFENGQYLVIKKDDKYDLETIKTYFIDYYSRSKLGSWTTQTSMSSELKTYTSQQELEFYELVRNTLTKSVKKRLMSDVPFGVLLSGGLDSSLITSITTKLIKENKVGLKWGDKIHSFAIGLEGSPDLIKAQETAEYLNTVHHSFTFTIPEALDAIKDVIYHLETYDITTIRASTPMYLLSRKIKAMGVKMVLSGEGADELLGGYLYFHKAPDDNEFHLECIRRVKDLSYFDCLRANKSTLAWGLEPRVPFLDKEFIDLALKIPPSLKKKNKIEKYVLRKAFDINNENGYPVYLPESILWRQKEQFSDGVGYAWIDTIRQLGEDTISDAEYSSKDTLYPFNTPVSKEGFMFRKMFHELFPNKQNEETVKLWIPRTDWDGVNLDPSGRAQSVHENATKK